MSTPVPASKQFKLKLWERVLWTAAQAGLALVTVEVVQVTVDYQIPTLFIPVIAAGLSWVKGHVARRVGNSQSPATLPWGSE